MQANHVLNPSTVSCLTEAQAEEFSVRMGLPNRELIGGSQLLMQIPKPWGILVMSMAESSSLDET